MGPRGPDDTGRIGSGQQLAEMYDWCPWGVLEVPSNIVETIYTKSSVGLMENSRFEKIADFPCMHVEMGWICPIWPSTPLATTWATWGQSTTHPHDIGKIGQNFQNKGFP